MSITPSIDTGICAASLRKFNEVAAGLENTVVLHITKDLPFAFSRFCAAEGNEPGMCTALLIRIKSRGTGHW